jgi:hypothetical protein
MADNEERKCAYKGCNRPTYRDHDRCIFHSDRIEEKQADFHEALKEWIGKCETDDSIESYDFTGFVFPEISFEKKKFVMPTDFSKSTFSGNADFYDSSFAVNANFYDSSFSGVADFEISAFSGNANFNKSSFSKQPIFRACKFNGHASYSESVFSKGADFRVSSFSKNTDFRASRFSDRADFAESDFYDDAHFRESTFSDETIFYRISFYGVADFEKSTFSGKVDFDESSFSKRADFSRLNGDGQLIFNKVSCKTANGPLMKFCDINVFKGSILLKNMNLKKTSFMQSNLDGFRFSNVTWERDEGREMMLADEKEALEADGDEKIKDVMRLYTLLKTRFFEQKNFVHSDACHYGELEMRRELKGRLSWEYLYKLVSDYGQNWCDPLLFAILIWVICLLCIGISDLLIGDSVNLMLQLEYYIRFNLYMPVPAKKFGDISFPVAFFSWVSKILTSVLLVMSAFAVKRKFRS